MSIVSTGATVLFAAADGWRVLFGGAGNARQRELKIVPHAAPVDAARQLAAALRAGGARHPRVVVGLDSGICLSASIQTAGLPRRDRHNAMLYRLEEKFPVAAEEVSADFVVHNGNALGVSTDARSVAPVLEALEAEGIVVAAVCPAALLALQGAGCVAAARPALDVDVLLWQDGSQLHLFVLGEGSPVRWATIAPEPADVALALAAQVLSRRSAVRISAVDVEPALLAGIGRLPDVTLVHAVELSCEQAAVQAAGQILSGREPPLANLRGGQADYRSRQLRPAITAALMAAFVLCLCLVGAALWRAERYAALAARAQTDKEAIFHRVFPRQPLPVGIQSRLQSAERQLRGVGSAGGQPTAPDTLALLHEVLAHLPGDARYRLAELDLDATRLTLDGQVRSHADADAIASALRRSPILIVEDPQTEQLGEQDVRFSLSGSVLPTPGSHSGRTP